MLKNIINTVFVRVFGAVITLLIVALNSNKLGAEGLGVISLIVLAVSIFVLINSITSGTLVYFIPRENIFKLLIISYLWVFVAVLLFVGLINVVEIAPPEYYTHIVFISVILAVSNIHEKVLVGKEKIILVNIITLLKILSLFISLLVLYFVFKKNSVLSYITSLYISYSLGLILTSFFIRKHIQYTDLKSLFPLFIKIFKLSGINAIANIVQKLNYRLSYYFIEYFLGIKALGMFSVGVQISESTLLIGRSISFVQYSRISNLKNSKKAIEITVLFVKLIVVISTAAMLILSFLPSSVYSLIFSKSFTNINLVVMSMSIGIIALSCTTVISPYFSGTGNQRLNALSATAGFIVTVCAGLILIPKYNIYGAGYTATLSYSTSMIYQVYLFKKQSGIKLSVFKINKHDIMFGIQTLKNLIKIKQQDVKNIKSS